MAWQNHSNRELPLNDYVHLHCLATRGAIEATAPGKGPKITPKGFGVNALSNTPKPIGPSSNGPTVNLRIDSLREAL
jgi:hypothetical protein